MENKMVIIAVLGMIGILGFGIYYIVQITAPGISGYFSLSQEEPKYKGPVEKVKIGVGVAPLSLPIWVAENKGFFVDNGLDVEIKEYPSGKAAVGDLIDDKVDMATITEFGFMSKSFDNPDLRIVSSITTANINSLVANKDKGIEEISDLKGKRIATVSGTEAEFFLGTFLLFNNIPTTDVEIIYLKPNELIDSVSSNEADAAIIWEPYNYEIKTSLGENAIVWPGQSGQSSYWLLNSKEDFVTNNPEIVKRFLKALLQAEEFTKTNENEAKAILVSHDLDARFVDDIWQKLDYITNLPQELIIAMEDGARWRIKNKLTDATEVPNYLNYIYLDALYELKPEVVNIIH